MNASTVSITSTNVAVVRGTVRAPAAHRTLPSGSVVAQFDVSTTVDGTAGAVGVPVSWSDPDPAIIVEGASVVVVGSVRRRFFRVGGVTQSRTELVADAVIPARRRAQVATALQGVTSRLTG
jgi:single-strand DNA-binding protein